jgi:hypothetical protein
MTGDNINGGGKFNVSRYAKETLWQNNIHGITDYRNNPGTAISKGLGLGFLGFHVAGQTKDGYEAAKAKYGDNSFGVAMSTAGTFGASAGKAAVTWEVSNILYDIGRTTLPRMTVGKIPLGGVLLGALGAVVAAHALDSLIPPPQKPQQANQISGATYQSMQQALQTTNPFGLGQTSQPVYA